MCSKQLGASVLAGMLPRGSKGVGSSAPLSLYRSLLQAYPLSRSPAQCFVYAYSLALFVITSPPSTHGGINVKSLNGLASRDGPYLALSLRHSCRPHHETCTPICRWRVFWNVIFWQRSYSAVWSSTGIAFDTTETYQLFNQLKRLIVSRKCNSCFYLNRSKWYQEISQTFSQASLFLNT